MRLGADIWAVVPVKEQEGAKQRLDGFLSPALRRGLAEVMLGEVFSALAASPGLAGIVVVTLDANVTRVAQRQGARIVTAGARDGHTGSVMAAARILAEEGRGGMLAMPGDIPCVTPAEIAALLAAHQAAPAFTIAPAHDELGSNAVLLSPPTAVPLRFGDNSYFPHLQAARDQGIEPTVLRLPGIAMDIDHPADLAMFARLPQSRATRTYGFLEAEGILALLAERGLL